MQFLKIAKEKKRTRKQKEHTDLFLYDLDFV